MAKQDLDSLQIASLGTQTLGKTLPECLGSNRGRQSQKGAQAAQLTLHDSWIESFAPQPDKEWRTGIQWMGTES
jgi:hypothetical protein